MGSEKESIYNGYESTIYLEERHSRQLYYLKTWYEGATYAQAVKSQALIIASFDNNPEIEVTYGRLEGVHRNGKVDMKG